MCSPAGSPHHGPQQLRWGRAVGAQGAHTHAVVNTLPAEKALPCNYRPLDWSCTNTRCQLGLCARPIGGPKPCYVSFRVPGDPEGWWPGAWAVTQFRYISKGVRMAEACSESAFFHIKSRATCVGKLPPELPPLPGGHAILLFGQALRRGLTTAPRAGLAQSLPHHKALLLLCSSPGRHTYSYSMSRTDEFPPLNSPIVYERPYCTCALGWGKHARPPLSVLSLNSLLREVK